MRIRISIHNSRLCVVFFERAWGAKINHRWRWQSKCSFSLVIYEWNFNVFSAPHFLSPFSTRVQRTKQLKEFRVDSAKFSHISQHTAGTLSAQRKWKVDKNRKVESANSLESHLTIILLLLKLHFFSKWFSISISISVSFGFIFSFFPHSSKKNLNFSSLAFRQEEKVSEIDHLIIFLLLPILRLPVFLFHNKINVVWIDSTNESRWKMMEGKVK